MRWDQLIIESKKKTKTNTEIYIFPRPEVTTKGYNFLHYLNLQRPTAWVGKKVQAIQAQRNSAPNEDKIHGWLVPCPTR